VVTAVAVPDNPYPSFSNEKSGTGAYISKTEDQPFYVDKQVTDKWGKGNFPCWIVMPWMTGSTTKFHWKFVRAGKSDVVTVERFSLLIAGAVEIYDKLEFDTNPSKISPGAKVNQKTKKIYEFKDQGSVDENPTKLIEVGCSASKKDPYSCMTQVQKDRSVTAEYLNMGEWDITFTSVGKNDQALEISGKICAGTTTTTTTTTMMTTTTATTTMTTTKTTTTTTTTSAATTTTKTTTTTTDYKAPPPPPPPPPMKSKYMK
jgi:hypothetical protein